MACAERRRCGDGARRLLDALANQKAAVLLVGAVDMVDQPVLQEINRVLHRIVLILLVLLQNGLPIVAMGQPSLSLPKTCPRGGN